MHAIFLEKLVVLFLQKSHLNSHLWGLWAVQTKKAAPNWHRKVTIALRAVILVLSLGTLWRASFYALKYGSVLYWTSHPHHTHLTGEKSVDELPQIT